MQMYANEDENEKPEKSKKKHRKSHHDKHNSSAMINGDKSHEFNNEARGYGQHHRRSEEENYEPSNEIRNKHRHRRSKTEDRNPNATDEAVVIRVEGDNRTIEEKEEARRQRREMKRRARERRKPKQVVNQNVQSPVTDEYDTVDHTQSRNPDLEQQINEIEPELMLGDEDPDENPSHELPRPKKKKGGFSKIFTSLKKRSKDSKNRRDNNDECQSNPELTNPASDNKTKTLDSTLKKIRGKSSRDLIMLKAHVILLDGEEVEVDIDQKATGAILFVKVCDDIDLIEKDFFGMTFVNTKLQTWFWLEMDKKISKQLGKDDEWTFNFQVKFYPPEPLLLQEDLTRYLLSLQVRQDVFTGKLPCSWITQALLGSFMVQSELGDYDEILNSHSIDYLREFEFVLNQSDQLLEKISELHKKHSGMTPERADIKYMETAKRLEQYGVDLHPARDNDDVEIFIGVSYQGIFIYRDRLKIGRFAWPKVIRISYKKNYFYLKIRSERYDDSVAIVGFKLFNHHLAKRLWKNAAEQHTFFRMKETQTNKNVTRLVSNASSSSGYSCKTLHQYRSMNIIRSQPVHFDRTISKRRTIGSMPADLNRSGLQYSSMHSLNRVHPRDMTLGHMKNSGSFSSKRPGSTNDISYGKESSIVGFTQARPTQAALFRPYGTVTKDEDRHQSFRSGDSLNCGESYTVNNDDQLSLPSISQYVRPVFSKPSRPNRSTTSSIDDLSEDGIISGPSTSVRPAPPKALPLPPPPDTSSSSDSDVTDSIQKLPLRFQQRQPPQNHGRSLPPPYRPSSSFPDPIPEPPSISSSVGSSITGQYMPPPPPSVDLQLQMEPDRTQDRALVRPKTSSMDYSRKPNIEPKPNVAVKERFVINKTSTTRHRDDSSANHDML